MESGGTGSARSSLTNSPMNPRAALGFSPFVPPTPRDSPGLTLGHHYQPSPAPPNGGGANVNYAPSLAHGGSFLQYAATAMATKGKAGSSAAPVVDAAAAVSDNAAAAAERASREYEPALRRWATANGVPSDAALVLPSTLTSPHPAVPYPYAAPGWLSPPSPVYHSSHSPSHSPLSPAHPYHGSNGYGMIPPANVASPPYLYAPAGGAYSPPQPPQPPTAYPAQTPLRRAAGGRRSFRLWAAGARGAAPARPTGAALSRPSPRAPRSPAASPRLPPRAHHPPPPIPTFATRSGAPPRPRRANPATRSRSPRLAPLTAPGSRVFSSRGLSRTTAT